MFRIRGLNPQPLANRVSSLPPESLLLYIGQSTSGSNYFNRDICYVLKEAFISVRHQNISGIIYNI